MTDTLDLEALKKVAEEMRAIDAYDTPVTAGLALEDGANAIDSLLAELERVREAAAEVLALPEAQERLAHLDRGIGTATPVAAWLRLRSAITQGGSDA